MKYFLPHLVRCAAYLLFLCFSTPLSAQETIVTYIKKNGGNTPHKDSAAYTSILRLLPNESGLYELNDYYATGDLKRHGWVKTIDPRRLRFEGLVETYYDNGILEATVYYADDKLIDTAKRYYRNGVLRESRVYLASMETPNEFLFTEMNSRLVYYADSMGNVQVRDGNGEIEIATNNTDIERGNYTAGRREGRWEGTFQKAKYRFEEWYENGILTKGMTTDSLGNQHTYQERDIQPEYPGGIQKLRTFIAQNYRYPPRAIQAKVVGQVVISFVVDKTGSVTDFEIVDDLGYGTGAVGIDVIKKAQDWIPGNQRGIPVRVKYSLPIRLNLASPSLPPTRKSSSP
ncbi:TonB family protein [Sphingobacterium olei]|uniref:TonB family protein n=1 Tax=Sphingobacterium olei TaxID=2571155 RepID=A0A4U0P2K2_9SPHI|nr:energy transducer TonB [Sphingobacterium olei]TJZ61465.1 TonB family protein [Sphingobacterium olei]